MSSSPPRAGTVGTARKLYLPPNFPARMRSGKSSQVVVDERKCDGHRATSHVSSESTLYIDSPFVSPLFLSVRIYLRRYMYVFLSVGFTHSVLDLHVHVIAIPPVTNECDSSRCWLIRPPTPYMLHVHIIARLFRVLTVPSSSLHLVARHHRHWSSPKVLTRRFVFQNPQPYMYHWCMYPHHRRCHSPPSPLKKHYR